MCVHYVLSYFISAYGHHLPCFRLITNMRRTAITNHHLRISPLHGFLSDFTWRIYLSSSTFVIPKRLQIEEICFGGCDLHPNCGPVEASNVNVILPELKLRNTDDVVDDLLSYYIVHFSQYLSRKKTMQR